MQQSCRRRSRSGEGEVVPRGQAVAHFSFAVGVCSFRFFMERKRARERVRRRLRAERGRHFRQIYSRAGRLSNNRGQRGGAAEGRETETHVTDLFHFRKHLSTQRICLKISNWAPSMPSHCSVRSSSVWGLFLKLTYRYSARRGGAMGGSRCFVVVVAVAVGLAAEKQIDDVPL